MAEFLDTQGVSYYLKKLINNSNDKLYLISPYLQLNNQLKLSLEDRHKFSIDIIIIYGKVSDINPDDSAWFQSMPGIKLLFHKDLHAKCYFNEKEAIVTSMNLFMFSQQNNVEMGIYISKEKDEELYKEVATEVERIKRGGEHRTISVQKVENGKSETYLPRQELKKDINSPTIITSFDGKYYSATAMSKEIGISSKELNAKLEDLKWIEKKNDETILTKLGHKKGAIMKKGQYVDYIAWPETIIDEILKEIL
jgi:phosphatidylserine/phosphatidylglycerophosphate/cardiolipin synthase-like enzyme